MSRRTDFLDLLDLYVRGVLYWVKTNDDLGLFIILIPFLTLRGGSSSGSRRAVWFTIAVGATLPHMAVSELHSIILRFPLDVFPYLEEFSLRRRSAFTYLIAARGEASHILVRGKIECQHPIRVLPVRLGPGFQQRDSRVSCAPGRFIS